ncbi:uncharacterized protein B0H18DRAFT_1129595 [Fomitopsis serialis]|uniref:uncharacterized protein n=1 Tax=Fomitopsis serialis TaxID=139415 RepID=UPI002007845E|nr:uncharacterized protein B0H18DRAFT_1129595 [Neoantrodia serialis]KAH9910757.1 hypothetical protein B0H18DRAFT_1129595 [Neoantrodia serialis]
MAPNVDHVTVLCLDKDHFGEYYDYCLTDQCPMSLSSYQTNPDDVDTMLERAVELRDPPAKFGGWIFMGAVPSMYRDGNLLRRLLSPTPVPGARRQPRAVLVEGLFFVSDGSDPVSVPLIGVVDATGKEITIPGPLEQPILRQGLRDANNDKPVPKGKSLATFDLYDPALQTFRPHRMEETFPIRLTLPLRSVPVFRQSEVQMTVFAHRYATGRPIVGRKPMCSMKYNFMGLDWIWPVGLPERRSYMEASWTHVVRGWPSYKRIAIRPEVGEDGCIVKLAGEGVEAGVQPKMEEDIDGDELGGEEVWELGSDGLYHIQVVSA